MERMEGTVTKRRTPYFVVSCPSAPLHLRELHLLRGQLNGAEIGDKVILEYQSTTRSGLWNVVEVKR